MLRMARTPHLKISIAQDVGHATAVRHGAQRAFADHARVTAFLHVTRHPGICIYMKACMCTNIALLLKRLGPALQAVLVNLLALVAVAAAGKRGVAIGQEVLQVPIYHINKIRTNRRLIHEGEGLYSARSVLLPTLNLRWRLGGEGWQGSAEGACQCMTGSTASSCSRFFVSMVLIANSHALGVFLTMMQLAT